MRRIFVYEAFSAQRGDPDPACADLLDAGRAMRDAIVLDLLDLPDVAVTCATGDGPDCGLPLQHARLAAATAPDDRELDFVRAQQALHDACWIVAPETGGRLERLQAAVAPGRRLGCAPQAIRIARSKRATLALMAAHGLPTPLAFDGADGWIVKPDDGAGTLGTRWHARRADAEADQAHRPDAVLEPFVMGEALSIAAIVAAEFSRCIAFNRQHIAADEDGHLQDLGVECAAFDDATDTRVPALRALAARVVTALPGLHGFVGIDLVWSPLRGPVLVEVNPRVTSAYVGLSARLGRNVALEVLRAAREANDVFTG